MKRYLVIIEKARRNYSAYCPDLPGCVATGPTISCAKRNMRQAILLHCAGMAEDRQAIPASRAVSADFIRA